MRNHKLIPMLLHTRGARKLQSVAARTAPAELESGTLYKLSTPTVIPNALEQYMSEPRFCDEDDTISIYKVPRNLRRVETKAYRPSIISIGPFHHGAGSLQAMEKLKERYFSRLMHPSSQNAPKMETLLQAMRKLEEEARSCYSEAIQLSSEKFTNMMVIDGCFIIELLREIIGSSPQKSTNIRRWMLPIIRRDLIMLENQLPLFVLSELFELTGGRSRSPNLNLEQLALHFFSPLMSREMEKVKISISVAQEGQAKHFLDLFRTTILPRMATRGKEPHMFRSTTELRESGVKLKIKEDCRPLELSFKRGVLKIPPLYIDDYRGTLFRNMIAFEQCNAASKTDVTTYLFFLDGLINSAKDVGLLHYAGVIQHTLGTNKEVANLINKLCKEVARNTDESYLHKMVWEINCHCNDSLKRVRARLAHDYFSNPWASISTIAAIVLLYLTLLQTCCGYATSRTDLAKTGFWYAITQSFFVPFSWPPFSKEDLTMPEEFKAYTLNQAPLIGFVENLA
ncbi:Protein of unknown function DUF247, plant [Dillenia turbinata]|uniref:Uncharacterized protein n=1 Tax=Dillenia turbinata TaxID=194707 RepID=A0AAN8VZG0_9MAGN